MKQLKEKARLRQIRRNKKRFPKELKRKAKRGMLAYQMIKVRTSARRIGRYQRQLIKEKMRVIRESSNTQ
jgi:hypothetical protein